MQTKQGCMADINHDREIEPEAIASVVVFLSSDAAKMVSRATYDVSARDSAHF